MNPKMNQRRTPSSGFELVLGTALDGSRRGDLVIQRGKDAFLHQEIAGTSGSGKSRQLASEFLQTMNQGTGVALIDPHRDTADLILGTLFEQGFYDDPRAYQRLLYIPFSRLDRFLAWNVLRQPYEPHTIARNVMEAWSRAFSGISDGQSPNLANMLLAGSFLLSTSGYTLVDLSRLFADTAFREQLLRTCPDPEITSFFEDRYDALGKGARALTESTLRRAFLLTYTPALRFTLGQRENHLQGRGLMDRGVSCLFDLADLDADTQRLLGCLLTMEFETAALSRANVPEEARNHYFLMIDEWSQFSAQSEESLERVLSLTRKFGLTLCLAHQTFSQVARKLQGALQNATFLAFRLGLEDAPVVAPRFAAVDPLRVKYLSPSGHPTFMSGAEQRAEVESTLLNLPPRHALARVNGATVRLQTLGLPDPKCSPAQLSAIKERYAQLLLTPKEQILPTQARRRSAPEVEPPAPPDRSSGRKPTLRRRVPLHPNPQE